MIIPLLLATTPLATQLPAIKTSATLAFEQPVEKALIFAHTPERIPIVNPIEHTSEKGWSDKNAIGT